MKENKLNDELIEVPHSKKLKIPIILTIISLAIIVTTTLLVGYFKLNWFKSEIYNIDFKILRKVYQINYFTEKKTLKVKVGFTNGITEEKEFTTITNFTIFQTEKKELEKNDFLNIAILAILDMKVNFNNEQKDIISFNVFNESVINEFKLNPNGTKYPMAIFSFYENGTIYDIKLPNNMNNYYANAIIELIENVIPKLSRNKTEDIYNGLKINTKNDKKKKILFESQSPKEIKEFKGSKFTKNIEREIIDEQLAFIKEKSNLELQSQNEDGQINFGLKDFKCEQNSEIFLTNVNERKKTIDLVTNLTKYYTFIDSKDLIQSLKDKEKINKEKNEDNEFVAKKYKEAPNSELRKLSSFSDTFEIVKFNALGNDISLNFYFHASEDGSFGGGLIFSASGNKVYFGTDSFYISVSGNFLDTVLFYFPFPPMPFIGIYLKACGSITLSYKVNHNSNPKMIVNMALSLDAKAEVKAGWDFVASVSAGAQGNIFSGELKGNVNNDGSMYLSGACGGLAVSVYVEGKTLDQTLFNYDYKVWDGWNFFKF